MPRTWSVLIVEADEETGERLGTWLADDGYQVVSCSGPVSHKGYYCPAERGGRCALVEPADVVVLDMRLGSDDAMQGPPGWQLLLYYVGLGKPVVALAGPGDPTELAGEEEHVLVLSRPPEREPLLRAVRSLLPEYKRTTYAHLGVRWEEDTDVVTPC